MKSSKHDLISFFLIAFAWSWLLNLPRLLEAAGLFALPPILSTILGYSAAFGPSVAAFSLTAIRLGRQGVKELWRRGFSLRAGKAWLLPALLLLPAAGLATLLVLLALGQPVDWAYSLPPAMIVPVGLLIWLLGAYPEEFGWRGYALDRLQNRFSPLVASLILGLLWGLWHLPLHFIPGTTQAAIPIPEFILQTVVLTILYTWLHNGSRGSVLIASLFHLTGNLTGALIPYWTTELGRWVSLLVLLVPTALVLWRKFTRPSHPVG